MPKFNVIESFCCDSWSLSIKLYQNATANIPAKTKASHKYGQQVLSLTTALLSDTTGNDLTGKGKKKKVLHLFFYSVVIIISSVTLIL